MPFLVLGNKSDVDEGLKKVSAHEAQRYCEEQGFLWQETSAKDNRGIEEGFRGLVAKVVERQERLSGKILGDKVEANADDKKNAIASNTSRRTARSTKTRVVLNEPV